MSSKLTTEELIEEYVKNGGRITKLRYASEKDLAKSSRKWRHKEKAENGNENSKNIIDNEKQKESTLIFSKVDRWKV